MSQTVLRTPLEQIEKNKQDIAELALVNVPTKTSQLTNDVPFLTQAILDGYATEDYVDESVTGLVAESEVEDMIDEHNTDSTAHADIRTAITNHHDSTKYDASNPNGYQNASEVSAAIDLHHDDTKLDVDDISLSTTAPAEGTPTAKAIVLGQNQYALSGITYTAGTNIAIDSDNKISVTGITVPTKTSDITNDSGFITKAVYNLDNYTKTSDLGDLATKDTVDYDTDITNKPTIPTKTSDLTNDSNFVNQTDLQQGLATKETIGVCYTKTETNAKYNVLTTEPTEAITDGGIHLVVLSDEPATKYDGYFYFIEENV